MFYAQFVLSRRGPLAKIWLAAHWDKKLTKAHIFETDLEDSVENIISPQVKIALRTSGHLLLGVVRIYNRKAKYLLADCNEAFVKIKMAFRPGVVDLPEENREAQHNQIYLVEEFHPFDVPLPDIADFDLNRHQTLNQSRIDDITMPEEVPTTLHLEDGFGGEMLGYEEKDVTENFTTEDFQNMFYKDGENAEKDDGLLGDHMGLGGGDDNELLGRSFLQGNGLFGEVPKGGLFGDPLKSSSVLEKEQEMEVDRDNNQVAFEPPSPPVVEDINKSKDQESILMPQITDTLNKTPTNETILPEPALDTTLVQNETVANEDQTTIIANTEEAFVLGPLDVTGVRDLRIRRKRKLIVDHMIELDGQTMREQLKDFKDIVTTMDMAPPTKKLMQWKEIGGVDKLFSRPCKVMADAPIKYFTANLHTFIPEDVHTLPEMEMQRNFKDHSTVDISMISNEVSRNDHNQNRLLHAGLESNASHSILSQGKDPSMHQFNVAGYTSDDNVEPVSVGPPSVESNFEDSEMMLQANPLPNDSIMSALDVNPPESMDNLFPTESPTAEDNENQAYADDVDDLRWNKRTQHLLRSLQRSFKHEHEVSFFRMTDGLNRKQAVSKFYSLLVLAKQEATNLKQFETFGDVSIQKGPKFDAILM